MAIVTRNMGHQHFSGSNSNSILFSRVVHDLLFNLSGTVSISMDGGDGYMTVTAGTHHWPHVNLKRLDIAGSGTWSGIGISL